MYFLFALSILIHFLAKFDNSARVMFILIRALQLVIHMALISVIFQANLMNFFEIIIPIVQFDFIDEYLDWDRLKFLKFDDKI